MRGAVHTWSPRMASLGRSVVAIGVFDGVHVGHQALLREAIREARRVGAASVAITFDRDPDQVVTPATAAPQLLTLEDKTRFLLDTGVDRILIVPFTAEVAAMEPEAFLDEVVGSCCDTVSVHVGSDFRFGARASGDIDTLYVWGVEHAAEIRPHPLLQISGSPVTSTRIRALVASGAVEEASALLGRPTRVTGVVRRGREQGASIGFPTANIQSVAYPAIPANGVYAGRAEIAQGDVFAAAISVGVPPSFPEARDHLEAHLIGYEGDLYGRTIALEFVARIRDQRRFDSMDELAAAIQADVSAATALLAEPTRPTAKPEGEWDDNPLSVVSAIADALLGTSEGPPMRLEDGTPVIEDAAALAEAERAVVGQDPYDSYVPSEEEWVPVAEPRHLSGIFGDAGFTAALVTAPLERAHIPFAWDPYPPQLMPGHRPGYGAIDRSFTLLVPASRLREAERLVGIRMVRPHEGPSAMPSPEHGQRLAESRVDYTTPEPIGVFEGPIERSRTRARVLVWAGMIALFGAEFVALLAWLLGFFER